MNVLGEGQAKCNTMTATHVTEEGLTEIVEGLGCTLYTDSLFFFSPALFDDLCVKPISYCWTAL